MPPRSSGNPILALEPLPEQLWNIGDLAKYLRKSTHAVYKMVERGQIPYVKIEQAVRFNPPVIREWIARLSIPPTQVPPNVDWRVTAGEPFLRIGGVVPSGDEVDPSLLRGNSSSRR